MSQNVSYTTKVSSIIRGHHVYATMYMSSTVGETLNTKPDNKEEAKDYDKFAIGVYKGDLLMVNAPIEISSLSYHFLNNNEQNTLTAIANEKRNREFGLVVPAKLFFQTKDRKSAETLKTELAKRKNLFLTVTL